MSPTQSLEYVIALFIYWSQQEIEGLDPTCSIEVAWGWFGGGEASFSNPVDPLFVQAALKIKTGFLIQKVEYRNQYGVHPANYLNDAIAQWDQDCPCQKAAVFNYPTSEHLRMEIARRGLYIAIQDDRIVKAYDEIVIVASTP